VTIFGFILVHLLAGASVAWAARVQIRNLQRPIFSNRYFSALMLFEAAVLLPEGIYFVAFYPDWAWMYLLDSNTVPLAVDAMALVAMPVTATMGFIVGYFSARSNSDWVTLMVIAFGVAGLLGMFVVARNKLLWVGNFEQYHRGVGLEPLQSTSLLPSLLLGWCGAAVCWVYLVYRFSREGRLSARSGA
jgi:hypothetical protein